MSRTHRWQHPEYKYFTHNGNFNEDRNKVKKNGAGKGNWGLQGDELNDLIDAGEAPPLVNKTRRGSNSLKTEVRLRPLKNYDAALDEAVA